MQTFLERFFSARRAVWLAALALLAVGLGLRLFDLKDPPLDFHPTRQLRAAIIARGMYYQMSPAADPAQQEQAIGAWESLEVYEPPLFEHLVAWTYTLIGSEQVWVARVYSSLFWLVGALAVFLFAKRAAGPGGALAALAFTVILPWGVIASRSFQPDPLMVMGILLAALAWLRWAEGEAFSWKWALLAGLLSGGAVLVKAVAAMPIAGVMAGALLASAFGRGWWKTLRNPQAWVAVALAVVMPAVYYLNLGSGSSEFMAFWTGSLSGLLRQSKFYLKWLALIRGIMDPAVFFAAILGAFLFNGRSRWLALGLWAGYALIGLIFPFQIYTHDYYSLFLVPLVGLSLAPLAEAMWARASRLPAGWAVGFLAALLLVTGYYAYVARSGLLAVDYSKEPIPWQKMGQALPTDGGIIGLTHDYGSRLKYFGWRGVNRLWPSAPDLELAEAAGDSRIPDFSSYFQSQTAGMDYFLVTLFADLEAQPDLKAMLYDHYPIAQEGDGYVLFDLRHPTE